MKRSGSDGGPGVGGGGGGGGGKRYDRNRSSPQVHNNIYAFHQQQHQQPPFYSGSVGSSQNYGRGRGGTPRMTTYAYNQGNFPRMWNFNMPPPSLPRDVPIPIGPPPTPPRPPLPRGPGPSQSNNHLPPLPPDEPAKNTNAAKKLQADTSVDDHMEKEAPDSQTVVNKKPKRKSMSSRYGCPKDWVREDAIKAIALEEEYSRRSSKAPILLLRFPDPDLNRDIISTYSSDIESVHFQQNSAPRYCFVHLKKDADVDKAISTISKIPFGTGFVSAELKRIPAAVTPSNPDEVDPYTLYIGNLPTTISSRTVKEHFPGAHRIDIGFAQRMKYTRYAFVRYDTVEDAMEAFKRSVNTLIESRSLIVRFRRQRSTIASGEPVPKKDGLQKRDDKSAPTALHGRGDDDVILVSTSDSSPRPFCISLDSPPLSISAASIVDADSKQNVLQEAEKLRLRLLAEKTKQMLRKKIDAVEQHNNRARGLLQNNGRQISDLNNFNSIVPRPIHDLSIKEEPIDNTFEDDFRVRDAGMLGARYNTPEIQIKPEPQDDEDEDMPPMPEGETYEDYNYEDDFEFEVDDMPPDPTLRIPMHPGSVMCVRPTAERPPEPPPEPTEELPEITRRDACSADSWEALRQMELSSIDMKTDVMELTVIDGNSVPATQGTIIQSLSNRLYNTSASSTTVTTSTKTTPTPGTTNAHASAGTSTSASTNILVRKAAVPPSSAFMEKLYAQVRNAKEKEASKRPRDDLDDMFARLNSDEESGGSDDL